MLSLILCALAVTASVSGHHEECSVICDERFILFNIERGCVPVHEDGHCCPSHFNCPSFENHSQCHVKGHAYDIGTELTTAQVGDKCLAGCRCVANVEDSTKAHVQCARVECPQDLGVRPPEGCKYTYSHDKCCHTGTTCDTDTDDAPFTCQHGDHTHRVGEKFHPDDHPCFECICMEGFNGTVKEPWCKQINCGLQESEYEGCAPIFISDHCCPVDWHCPKEGVDWVVSSNTPVPADSPKCKFGTHEVDLWSRMRYEGSCIECKCNMPPHLSCEKKKDCDGA